MAEFFLANVIVQTGRGYEVRALVDVAERVTRVKNEGLNLTGAIRVLQLAASAAGVLGIDAEFAARCSGVASGLVPALDLLYNGRYFMSAEDVDTLNFSSLAPVYPMMVIPPDDPRAISTAHAYLEQDERRRAETGTSSPWSAGVLATVFALRGDGDTAWRIVSQAVPAICEFGGMSEYVFGGDRWNMQYFSTGQAAVCTAIHHLMLQERDGEIYLFPAVPSGWPACSFDRLLVSGIEVSGRFDRAGRHAQAEIRNIASDTLDITVRFGGNSEKVQLVPAQVRLFEWEIT